MLFKRRGDPKTWSAVSRAALMGTNMVASTVVGLAIGFYLNPWSSSSGGEGAGRIGYIVWLFFWMIMGIIQGFRSVYLETMKIHKASSQDKNDADSRGNSADSHGDGGKPDV